MIDYFEYKLKEDKFYENIKDKNVIFLIGLTKSVKNTFKNFLQN